MGKFSRYHRFHNASEGINIINQKRFGTPLYSLYSSSKVFTLHHSMQITDASDNVVYTARTKFFTIHDKTDIYNAQGEHVSHVSKKFFTLHERHFVKMDSGTEFELSNELFHIVKDITNIEGLGWQLRGNIWGLNFELYDIDGSVIAVIGQKMISIHDKYCIDIYKREYEEVVITILITLQHMIKDREETASGSSSSGSSNS